MINLEDVATYLGKEFLCPMSERTRLKAANFVTGPFKRNKTKDTVSLIALCRQSSNFGGDPHILNVCLISLFKK